MSHICVAGMGWMCREGQVLPLWSRGAYRDTAPSHSSRSSQGLPGPPGADTVVHLLRVLPADLSTGVPITLKPAKRSGATHPAIGRCPGGAEAPCLDQGAAPFLVLASGYPPLLMTASKSSGLYGLAQNPQLS